MASAVASDGFLQGLDAPACHDISPVRQTATGRWLPCARRTGIPGPIAKGEGVSANDRSRPVAVHRSCAKPPFASGDADVHFRRAFASTSANRRHHSASRPSEPRRWALPDSGTGDFDPHAQPAPEYAFDQRIAWQPRPATLVSSRRRACSCLRQSYARHKPAGARASPAHHGSPATVRNHPISPSALSRQPVITSFADAWCG